ncbi:hypothetical protein MNBD_GAMMA11-341, partial [hydrothermal vent metagenome]
MTAFFIANVKIKDPQKFHEYAQKAGDTFATYGAEPVLRGKFAEVLAGSADHQAVGIVKFPDQEALTAWFNSDAYQAIVPLRNEAAEMTIVT